MARTVRGGDMAGEDDPNGNIFKRNPAAVLTAAVSVLAIAFGFLQFVLSERRSAHEAAMEQDRLAQQTEIENARATQEWKLALTRFATENYDQIFAEDEAKRARLRALMNATFPPELLRGFYQEQSRSATTFTEVAELSQAYAALGALQQQQPVPAPPPTQPAQPAPTGAPPQAEAPVQVQAPRIAAQATIYLQYADQEDEPAIDLLMGRLRADGFRTPGRELVTKFEFPADVRYFHDADKEDAEQALAELSNFLRERGLNAPSTPKDLSKSYPNVPEGVVEVWIPHLAER